MKNGTKKREDENLLINRGDSSVMLRTGIEFIGCDVLSAIVYK
jgi:hypothetical protein